MDPTPGPAQPNSAQGGSMFDGLAVGSSGPAQARQYNGAFQDGPASAADMFGGLSLSPSGQSSASAADPLGGLSMPSPLPATAGEYSLDVKHLEQ